MAGFSLQVKGNWVNSSVNADPFVQGAQTVTFNGTAAQAINNTGNANGTVFNNVTFTNSTGFTLNTGNVVVQSTLTFSAAGGSVVNLNSLNLTIGTAAATPGTLVHTQASADGWVYGGNLVRFVNTGTIADLAGTGFFPMGNATDFRPFYISCPATGITTGGTFTVSHALATNTIILPPAGTGIADASAPAKNILLQHQASWSVSSAGVVGGAGSPFNLIAGGTGFGTVAALADLRLCKSASVVGTYVLATGSTLDPRLKRTGLTLAEITTTGGSQFFVGSTDAVNSPLPITLLGFTAKPRQGEVELHWKTESELNNDYFTIQKTFDGEHFSDVSRVAGAGTTTMPQSYRALDLHASAGKWYYRLKQTDFNGTYAYSKLVSVDVVESLERVIYPNPSSGDFFTIGFSNQDMGKSAFIQLHDLSGREIHRLDISNLTAEEVRVEPSQQLPGGIYVVSILVENQKIQRKLVVR